MKGHSLYIIILITIIQQYQCEFICQNEKSKRSITSSAQGDPHSNITGNRFMRSTSQNSEQKADLVLLIDVSGSITKVTVNKLKKNLRDLTNSKAIDIGRTNVRLGIITFATDAKLLLGLKEGITHDAVLKAVEKIKYGGGTDIADGFNKAKEEFIKAKDRQGIQRVAILISDGAESCVPTGTINSPKCANNFMDCNFMLQHCPQPPPPSGTCGADYDSVFGQFDELKKAGGSGSKLVTLAVIGVGDVSPSRDRLRCWATEQLYSELSTYDKLKETIEDLVTRIVPKNRQIDCECFYSSKDKCAVHNNKCGYYLDISITRNASSNGQPCPKEKKKWHFCRYKDCGMTIPGSHNNIEQELVRPTKPPDASRGIAWWSIFIILLGVVAFILLVGILMVVVMRKRRARRAVTAGVQPSVMEPLTVITEREKPHIMAPRSSASLKAFGKAYPPSTQMHSQSIQRSVGNVSKSGLPSSMQNSKQEWTSPMKVRSNVQKSGSLAFVKSASLKTAVDHSNVGQSGKSFIPMSIHKWKAPPRQTFQ